MNVNNVTNLSRLLQKYYRRCGNRIIFANKMTLNQLALKLWERLGYQGVDTSVLSRVINGERLFTPRQLEVFCDVLGLDEHSKALLKNALTEDYYLKYDLDVDLSFSSIFFDLVDESIKRAISMGNKGELKLSFEWINFLEEKLKLARRKNLYLKSKNMIDQLLAKLLFEKANLYFALIQSPQALRILRPIAKKIIEIGRILNSKEIFSQGLLIIGDAYYVANMFNHSLNLLHKGLKDLKADNLRLRIFRIMLLDYAYVKSPDNFKEIERLAKEELEDNVDINITQRIDFYEGFGRAQGILKIPGAYKSFEKAEKLYEELRKNKKAIPFKEIQLIRSQLEAISYLGSNNKNYMERIGKKGLQIALKYGYKRHAMIIRKILTEKLT